MGKMVAWLLLRGAHLRALDVGNEIPTAVLEEYIRRQGGHLRHLSYYRSVAPTGVDSVFLLVAQHCQSLEYLRLSCTVSPAYLAALFSSCKNLTTLHVRIIQIDSLAVLTTMCNRLTRLEADIGFHDKVEMARLCTIANLRGLQDLSLPAVDCSKCDTAMRAIATSCIHLKEVRLYLVSTDALAEFARSCPAMQSFIARVSSAVSPELLNTIAQSWKDLRHLVLRHNMVQCEWTDQHDAAVVNLIRQVLCLQVLILINGRKPAFLGVYDTVPWSVTQLPRSSSATSALREIWVTRLSAGGLKTVLTSCPDLRKVIHVTPADPAFLATLAESNVTDVSFTCTGVTTRQLVAFRNLTALQLWDIGEGHERAIVEVAENCPGLETIRLRFKRRPSLCLFPNILRHVPGLRGLSVKAGALVTDSDEESGAENTAGSDPAFVKDAVRAIEAFVELLCPSMDWNEIAL
jgi:hypothetical protein